MGIEIIEKQMNKRPNTQISIGTIWICVAMKFPAAIYPTFNWL